MRLLVTRPQPQADEAVARLRQAGHDAVALPLIDIAGPADPAAVQGAWAALPRQDLVVFVSPNAVQRFFDLAPGPRAWPAPVLAGAPGPGTADALAQQGVPASAIVQPAPDAPGFDSESLWAQLQPLRGWRDASVLLVRGEGGRDWLMQTLQAQGARVTPLQAYRRQAPTWSSAQHAAVQQALDQPRQHLWLLSSSEAIDHLVQLAPQADWSSSRALATHPRIAGRARRAGFGEVLQADPGLPALLQALAQLPSSS